MRILVSACLTGENCKYNVGNNCSLVIHHLAKENEIIPVCPEVAGGLPTPRVPSEIRNGNVTNREGKNVDREFRLGAEKCLQVAKERKADFAILQSRSPSCGVKEVYDGSFSGKTVPGSGIFAELLIQNGIPVKDIEDMEPGWFLPLKTVWKYLKLDQELSPSDVIIGFGNYNTDIARRAAELYFQGYASKILFSGGLGRNTLGVQSRPEAERFAAVALQEGVPERDILIENRSTNTAENIRFVRQLLEENEIFARRLIGVHQPFMERRIWAAFGIYWPEVEFLVTSPQVNLAEFILHAEKDGTSERTVIEEIVGDFQRMDLYAQRGWQIPQEIPEQAQKAYEELVKLGYTGQLA